MSICIEEQQIDLDLDYEKELQYTQERVNLT